MKAIRTTYHGPTDYKGSRITATDGENGRVTLSWDYSLNADENHYAAACAFRDKMEWTNGGRLIGGGFPGASYYWVFEKSMPWLYEEK